MKLSTLFAVTAIALSVPLSAQEKKEPAAPATAAAKIVNVTPEEAERLIASGVTVIDFLRRYVDDFCSRRCRRCGFLFFLR